MDDDIRTWEDLTREEKIQWHLDNPRNSAHHHPRGYRTFRFVAPAKKRLGDGNPLGYEHQVQATAAQEPPVLGTPSIGLTGIGPIAPISEVWVLWRRLRGRRQGYMLFNSGNDSAGEKAPDPPLEERTCRVSRVGDPSCTNSKNEIAVVDDRRFPNSHLSLPTHTREHAEQSDEAVQSSLAQLPSSRQDKDLPDWYIEGPPTRQRVKPSAGQRRGICLVEELCLHGSTNISCPQLDYKETSAWVEKLFDLPLHEKLKLAQPRGRQMYHGYSWPTDPFMTTWLAGGSQPGVVESYVFWGDNGSYGPETTILPEELVDFQVFMSNLCRKCHTTASEYLRLIATGLGLPPDNPLSKAHDFSSGYLCLLRFPPMKPGSAYSSCSSVRPYFGRGIISLRVKGSNEPPQTVSSQSYPEFAHMTDKANSVVLSVGTLLERWSNGVLEAVKQDTILSQREHSVEISYHLLPSDDALIECLPTCQNAERPAQYEPIRWRDLPRMTASMV